MNVHGGLNGHHWETGQLAFCYVGSGARVRERTLSRRSTHQPSWSMVPARLFIRLPGTVNSTSTVGTFSDVFTACDITLPVHRACSKLELAPELSINPYVRIVCRSNHSGSIGMNEERHLDACAECRRATDSKICVSQQSYYVTNYLLLYTRRCCPGAHSSDSVR